MHALNVLLLAAAPADMDGVAAGASRVESVMRRFGPTETWSVENDATYMCWASDREDGVVVVTARSDAMGGYGLIVTGIRVERPTRAIPKRCKKVAGLRGEFANGLRLGMSVRDVPRVLGEPRERANDHLVFTEVTYAGEGNARIQTVVEWKVDVCSDRVCAIELNVDVSN